ncbi:IS30 family transposase [Veillonella caviae]
MSVLALINVTYPVSLVERKARFYMVLSCSSAKAADVRTTLEAWFLCLAKCIDVTIICKSITADNDREFYELTALENNNLQVYYAPPYSSWERGSNEKHNGLFRIFVPKGIAIKDISDETLKRSMEWANTYREKSLDIRVLKRSF